jgi:hypothetical protein
MRDAYLQRRRNLIHDGNPPREAEASIDGDMSPIAAPHDDGVEPRAAMGSPAEPVALQLARTEPIAASQ